ncbi:MAG TPA: prepilin peptidase [Sphingomicrobium sp.]
MNLLAGSPGWIVGILIALLAAAAVQDAVQLRISNLITVSALVLAVVAAAVTGFQPSLVQNVVVFGLVLTAGAILFSRGLFGGGDVKLLAAVALWVDAASALLLIAAILICGGILALLILFLRAAVPQSVADRVRTLQPRAGIPYGVAIAAGTLVAIALFRYV